MLVITLIFGISWRALLMVLMVLIALIANRLPTLLLTRRLAFGDCLSMMHKIRECACGGGIRAAVAASVENKSSRRN